MHTGSGRLRHLAGCFAALLVALPAFAQFGHPLKGTWSGDWGTGKDNRHRVLLELNWNGKEITGAINPGPSAVPLKTATVNPSNWTVRLEAEGKSESGRAVRYLIEGKLENLGSYYRLLSGTWTQGEETGDFKLTRN